MKKLYQSSANLDKRAISKFLLSEEILMENAANSLMSFIARITHKQSVITIICGSGDNGGDGYALARKLKGDYIVRVYEAKEPKSSLCKLQAQRAQVCGVEFVKKILPCDVVVDCLFGSGFSGKLDSDFSALLKQAQASARVTIACDIPSGLDISNGFDGRINEAFRADYTVSMGALKVGLFSDSAKDFVGEVIVGDLGVSRSDYEVQSPFFLLEKTDLVLPIRKSKSCHKGDFGHIVFVCGEKLGASLLAAKAGLKIGAGKVSLMSAKNLSIESSLDSRTHAKSNKDFSDSKDFASLYSIIAQNPEIMLDFTIPKSANVLTIGMGLGNAEINLKQTLLDFCNTHSENPRVLIDADLCYEKGLREVLQDVSLQDKIVLTPHAKEFASLAHICGILDSSDVDLVVARRFELALKFSQTYPHATLLLKGANTIIAQGGKIYINALGSQALAKGGSGDVLCGVISAYLAQGFSPLDSAINGSLSHALASHSEKNSYSLTPLNLIEHLGNLS